MIEIFTTPEGLTLSYERRGSGPLLVCHPGGPGGSGAEFEDFAGLEDTFELLLFNPRGSHGSDPAVDYALVSYAADLEAPRQHLGVAIPHSGHFAYVEQPEAFRTALTDFLL